MFMVSSGSRLSLATSIDRIMSHVKLEGIRSSTLAEMRQNDLQLVATDVYASAKSVSDLVTHYDNPAYEPEDYWFYYK